MRAKSISMLLVVAFLVALAAMFGSTRPVIGSGGLIDQMILNELVAKGTANLFVKMSADANLDAAYGITSRMDRLNYVHDTLTAQAAVSQAPVIRLLEARGVSYESFWINNSV